jgi:hypothetical protein
VTHVDARFLANVFGGDAVEAGGRIVSVVEETDGVRINCEVWLNVDGRSAAVAGTASLLLAAARRAE